MRIFATLLISCNPDELSHSLRWCTVCTNKNFQTMVSDLVVCHPCTPKIEVRRSLDVKSLSISWKRLIEECISMPLLLVHVHWFINFVCLLWQECKDSWSTAVAFSHSLQCLQAGRLTTLLYSLSLMDPSPTPIIVFTDLNSDIPWALF